jgi:hypothetical protein
MSYGAIIHDMISRMRQNKELRQKHQERYRKFADARVDSVYKDPAYSAREEPGLSEVELAYYRNKALKSNRVQRIINIAAIAAGILIIILLFILL